MDKKTILLANRCRFHLGDIPDAWQAWYDDSEWEDVTLPHDWSVGLPFSREYIPSSRINRGVSKSGSPTPKEMASGISLTTSKNFLIPEGFTLTIF